MHQTRATANKKIPIPRKGTKYVARPLRYPALSVPVVVAVRDMLHLAKTAKEVKEMIKDKALKINGRQITDYRDSITLFNIFEADKPYILMLTQTGKFAFEETKSKERPCKVINKKMLPNKKLQLNLHDGTNLLSDDKKINTQDTIYLDEDGKIKKHHAFEKGKECFIFEGKFIGHHGKIDHIEDNKVLVKIKNQDAEIKLQKKGVIVL